MLFHKSRISLIATITIILGPTWSSMQDINLLWWNLNELPLSGLAAEHILNSKFSFSSHICISSLVIFVFLLLFLFVFLLLFLFLGIGSWAYPEFKILLLFSVTMMVDSDPGSWILDRDPEFKILFSVTIMMVDRDDSFIWERCHSVYLQTFSQSTKPK